MDIVEQYLRRLTEPPHQKSIEYDDPKKFKFKPPGMQYPTKGIIKGAKPKFKRQAPGIKR